MGKTAPEPSPSAQVGDHRPGSDALATQTNRSRNELIGILLDYALDRCVVDGEG